MWLQFMMSLGDYDFELAVSRECGSLGMLLWSERIVQGIPWKGSSAERGLSTLSSHGHINSCIIKDLKNPFVTILLQNDWHYVRESLVYVLIMLVQK